jgi:hypothetical protein
MKRMELAEDENLRQQGWRVFRSASRDRMIPLVGAGAQLQRIKIGEALPVMGVFEGVALPLEEREARHTAKVEEMRRAPDGEDVPTGIMQYFTQVLFNTSVGAVNNVPTDDVVVVGVAPFDGWLREFTADPSGGDASGNRVAVRTSSGGTLFRGFHQSGLTPGQTQLLSPDFIALDGRGSGLFKPELRGGKVPVYAGDQILVVVRNTNGLAALQMRIVVNIGIEAVFLGSVGRRASVANFSAVNAQVIAANRESARQAGMLAIEQEKTRRVELAAQAEAALLAQKLSAVQAAQSARPPVPAPRVTAPKPEPPDGTGKTFVSAWNPSFGVIGYLIPDPPRGGKVNVFDNKYSVFDITGKLIEQGAIEPIRTDADIPPGARLSPVRGGVKSAGMRQDTLEALT